MGIIFICKQWFVLCVSVFSDFFTENNLLLIFVYYNGSKENNMKSNEKQIYSIIFVLLAVLFIVEINSYFKLEKIELMILSNNNEEVLKNRRNIANASEWRLEDYIVKPYSYFSSKQIVQLKNYLNDEYKYTMTSVFWAGEGADASNDYISNRESYWDVDWMESFGGIDDPNNRCGYWPCEFEPQENPFYFALPYGDYDEDGEHKDSLRDLNWYRGEDIDESILKNRWIEIVYKNQVCYGQWEDVGPMNTDDYDYVFGSAMPENDFGVKAGLDVSPALRDCLGMETNVVTAWRFIEEDEVPSGPWKTIVTESQVNY
ncbi:hypothetical protein C0583_02430 [Candidatus Parcubacteria bacterium]|nr:MAG: hypothetical protein C0583_02430 [Candidatus Parcubacteria bacterium]